MTTPIELTDGRLWEFCCIQHKMLKWDDLVVTAMVQGDSWDARQLCRNVFGQSRLVPRPELVCTPIRGGQQKKCDDRFVELLFGKIFDENRSTYRMPDQNNLVV